MNKLILGLGASVALATAPAAAATLVPGAPGTTTIDLADDFAAFGLVVGVSGAASDAGDGVFVLPMSVIDGASTDNLIAAGPSAEAFGFEESALTMTTADGIMVSLTDLVMDTSEGVVSGLVRIDDYLPNGDVLYGRMDLFSIGEADGDMMFDMVVDGMAGETLATYLGVDIGKEAFAQAMVSSLETPLPAAALLFGTALLGGAAARRRAGR